MEIRNDGISRIAVGVDDFGDGPRAVMLWVPNVNKFDHDHITFTPEEAQRLYEFLHEYLGENPPK